MAESSSVGRVWVRSREKVLWACEEGGSALPSYPTQHRTEPLTHQCHTRAATQLAPLAPPH